MKTTPRVAIVATLLAVTCVSAVQSLAQTQAPAAADAAKPSSVAASPPDSQAATAANQEPAADAPEATTSGAPAEPAQAADPPELAEPAFGQEQLDQMLAPIALYPDALLMQLMMAATYPLEIVEADRWRKKNPALKDAALEKALEAEDWDPSVKAMAIFPDLLGRMSENLDWTQDLGDAFLSQQAQVLDTIQALRKQAHDAGNLESTAQQNVVVNNETHVIEIEPAQPETVYVPQYNSAAAHGTPPPAAPYYPTANTYTGTDMLMTGALSFGAGLLIGNLIWDDDSDCDWDDHEVYGGRGNNNDINIEGDVNIGNQVGSGNRRPQQWQHDPSHRRGVNYRDPKTRQTYAAKSGGRPGLDRSAARGYSADTLGSSGRGRAAAAPKAVSPTARASTSAVGKGATAKMGSGVPGKGAAAKKPSAATAGKGTGSASRASAGSRAAPAASKGAPSSVSQKRPSGSGGIGSAGGNRPTAVGGLGGGSATRAASARGAASRGSSRAGTASRGGSARTGGGGGRRR
jgi:hypothetical protein